MPTKFCGKRYLKKILFHAGVSATFSRVPPLKIGFELGTLDGKKDFHIWMLCYQQGEGARKLSRNFVDSFIEELDTGEM